MVDQKWLPPQCGSRAGAGAKITDVEGFALRLFHQPLRGALETPYEKIDIETGFVSCDLPAELGDPSVEFHTLPYASVRDKIIPRAMAAAAAAMGEQHDAPSLPGDHKRTL